MAFRVGAEGDGDLNGIGELVPAIAVTKAHDLAGVGKRAIEVDRCNLCLGVDVQDTQDAWDERQSDIVPIEVLRDPFKRFENIWQAIHVLDGGVLGLSLSALTMGT